MGLGSVSLKTLMGDHEITEDVKVLFSLVIAEVSPAIAGIFGRGWYEGAVLGPWTFVMAATLEPAS